MTLLKGCLLKINFFNKIIIFHYLKQIVSSYLLSLYKPPNLLKASKTGFCAEVKALPQINCFKAIDRGLRDFGTKTKSDVKIFSVIFSKKITYPLPPPPSL